MDVLDCLNTLWDQIKKQSKNCCVSSSSVSLLLLQEKMCDRDSQLGGQETPDDLQLGESILHDPV